MFICAIARVDDPIGQESLPVFRAFRLGGREDRTHTPLRSNKKPQGGSNSRRPWNFKISELRSASFAD
jgi:hypothetical protein